MPNHDTIPIQDHMPALRRAVTDQEPISGLTHTFYRYPARFSPTFARAAIEAFSQPGQTVLDPFMGGGTTVVEAFVAGRRAIGADINSLSRFIARAKVTPLRPSERLAIENWAYCAVPLLRVTDIVIEDSTSGPRNMTLPQVRHLRKMIAICIHAADHELSTPASRNFARCVMLNVGQWALNGRRVIPTVAQLRDRVGLATADMLAGIVELGNAVKLRQLSRPTLIESDAESLSDAREWTRTGPADLIVTSPPYPGIHMLYHRWQVDGRKETDAPYWIAGCQDGQGAAHYNFADRREAAIDKYFEKAEASWRSIRKTLRPGAVAVQLIAFSDPGQQLRKYLSVMQQAGLEECRAKHERRIWRDVPGRRWHANSKGHLASSREVMLVHEAV